MDEVAELRHMLMGFRVSELQVLLGFAGRSKSGRKHELMGRALQLLKCEGNYQIRAKIKDLYRQRYPRKLSSPPPRAAPPGRVCIVPQSVPVRGREPPNGIPVHPDVRLISLPFFEYIDDLVRPTSLVPRGMSQFQESYVVFHLTPRQVNLITTSRDIRPNSKNEYTVQVQIRFCLFETSCEQEDNFPSSLCVKVNGKICPLPGYVPPGTTEAKRPSRPINITSLCRLSSTVPNHVHITWTPRNGQRHVVVIRQVRQVTSSCLMQKLKAKGYRNPDHSRALIKEKLAHDPESEVATTSLRVTLLCPLGKTRMTLPCRASTCNHLQCFDLALYLQMNERKTTWVCPVCDKKALYKDIFLDGLFREILDSAHCKEIAFYEDGSWRPIDQDGQDQESKAAVKAIIASNNSLQKSVIKASSETSSFQKREAEIIDLTGDSDSDDDDTDDDDNDDDDDDEERDEGIDAGDDDKSMDTDMSLYREQISSTKISSSINGYPKRVSSSSVIMPPSSSTSRSMAGSSSSSSLFNHPNFYSLPHQLEFPGLELYRFLNDDTDAVDEHCAQLLLRRCLDPNT
ncbi:E3 SUMO-protein ligase PIAS3-like isoform X2 [Actinia tenebrosa]|uniref:E3 SUMO-protein ligase PIAS3-like isoform X2 n=1 Tax=Actinia tenebrosa TaxID=6105 RepID=A0A6P8H576_ACTTE|nr:E3 SUMO-protein ligase PIAS3-like isoform X2 [Actinia tenebrosa]